MLEPNATMMNPFLGGLGKDSAKYFDRKWKSHFKIDTDTSSLNPLQQLLFISTQYLEAATLTYGIR